MSNALGHLGDDRLQRFADGEIVEAEVRQHVDACAECSRRLEEIELRNEEYAQYHAELKASDPAPPREWEDLRPRMTARPMRWRVWGAVAATVLVAFAAYDRMSKPAAVNAAELLRKAAAAEKPSKSGRRIRVKTTKRELVRPAFVVGGVSTELESMFLSARFSWQEPLSARSFAAWREGLSEKQDVVREEDGGYEIETTTSEGPLRAATIVLDGDLRAVRETLVFASETVEIAAVEVEPDPAPIVPPAGVKPSAPAALAAGPSTELRALAALHAIGADLGEPVQVTRGDEVVVTATGLTEARERQVRAAVESIPGVVYRSEAVPLPDGRGSARGVAVAQGRASQLAGVLGEDGVNRILDASEAVMARAFALRGLSRRFPHVVEAQLVDADRDVLASMRSEHVAGIRRHVAALQASVAPLLSGKVEAAAAAVSGDWQSRADRLFTAAQAVDHLLTRVLAGGQDFSRLAPELGDALANLDAEARQ